MAGSNDNIDLHGRVFRNDARLDSLEAQTRRIENMVTTVARMEEALSECQRRTQDNDLSTVSLQRQIDAVNGRENSVSLQVAGLDRRTARALRVTSELGSALTRLDASTLSFVEKASALTVEVKEAVGRIDTLEAASQRFSFWWVALWVVTSAVAATAGALLVSFGSEWLKRKLLN